MKVLLNDPPLFKKTGDKKFLPLKELFDCDFITLHTPLTIGGIDKTYHLADEKFFNSLKNGCIFLNTARGAVADTAAVKKAIKSSKIKASIIDVWENEPDIDVELLEIADIATPHVAGYSLDGKVMGMIMVYNALCRYFGLDKEKSVQDFLPEPEVAKIEIGKNDFDEQETIRQTVQKIYDISKDDNDFEQALKQPSEKTGSMFHNLRKSYHFRREFHNTICILATEDTRLRQDYGGQAENTEKKLVEKLKGIGFKVSENEQE